jgi:hypothetical protein
MIEVEMGMRVMRKLQRKSEKVKGKEFLIFGNRNL